MAKRVAAKPAPKSIAASEVAKKAPAARSAPAVRSTPAVKTEAAAETAPALKSETAMPEAIETEAAAKEATAGETKTAAAQTGTPQTKTPKSESPKSAKPVKKAVRKAAKPRQTGAPAAAAAKLAVPAAKPAAGAQQDFTAMSKAAMDAYVRSGSLFARSFGTFNREVMAFAQATMESNIETARALAAAGSLREMVDLQTKHSQKSIDDFLAESAKLTELSMELANETMAPLQSSIKETVERLLKPMAA